MCQNFLQLENQTIISREMAGFVQQLQPLHNSFESKFFRFFLAYGHSINFQTEKVFVYNFFPFLCRFSLC